MTNQNRIDDSNLEENMSCPYSSEEQRVAMNGSRVDVGTQIICLVTLMDADAKQWFLFLHNAIIFVVISNSQFVEIKMFEQAGLSSYIIYVRKLF